MFLHKLIKILDAGVIRYILRKKTNEERVLRQISIRHEQDTLSNRFDFLVKIAGYVLPEYKFKWPQLDWWKNTEFNEYLIRFGEDKVHNADRRWMIFQLMRMVDGVEGDTAECGVYNGSTSWLMCKSNQNSKYNRKHFVFDSFCGLSEPSQIDGDHWRKGDLSCSLEETQEKLSEFNDIHYMEGWIPERFVGHVVDCQFSFVHIDVDLYEPTRLCIEFFYPRVPDGGIIVCDDYGSLLCPGATKAVDEYLLERAEKMIPMSGGGGFIIKGISVSV